MSPFTHYASRITHHGRAVIGITTDTDGERFSLRQDYVTAVERAGGLPLLIPPVSAAPELAKVLDGLLLPGGDDILPEYYGEDVSVSGEMRFVRRERTEFEISLLREMLDRRKPVLAVCYGMQLVNVAFGGSLIQDIGEQLPGSLDHRKGPHEVIFTSLSPFEGVEKALVNSHHHQSVREVGKGLDAWAFSADGIIEGIYKKDYPFLVGVQWHPERKIAEYVQSCDILSPMIFTAFIRAAGGDDGG